MENIESLRPSDPRFGCGPSLVPVEFLKSLAQTGSDLLGTSHRKPAVKNLVKEVQEGIRKYFKVPADYEILVGNGGATFLFDAISLGLVKNKALHYTCGEFSTKWYKAANNVPWIEADHISEDFGRGITPEVKDGYDMICATLNETSTGVQVDKFPDTLPEDVILAVDATSGGGQCPCDVSKVDLFFFSPQKVFASEGGTFVAIASPKVIKRALEINEDKSRYIPDIMNWKTIIDNSVKNQTYNTPSITSFYLLNEELKLLNKVGYEEVILDSKKKADYMYNWATEKEYLSCYIEDPKYRSIAVATIDVDEKIDTKSIISFCEENKLAYGIDAYRKLGRNQFRIALFYNVKFDDLVKLTKILDIKIQEQL